MDRLIHEFDRALRAIVGVARASRRSPAEERAETPLDEKLIGPDLPGRAGLSGSRP